MKRGRRDDTKAACPGGVITLFAGLEAPTGDPRRLREKIHPAAATTSSGHDHGEVDPGTGAVDGNLVHGYRLALGSGSWDGVAGASGFVRQGRFYATGYGQYVVHGSGAYGYRWATAWSSAASRHLPADAS